MCSWTEIGDVSPSSIFIAILQDCQHGDNGCLVRRVYINAELHPQNLRQQRLVSDGAVRVELTEYHQPEACRHA